MAFIKRHGRPPSRHWPMSTDESSLAEWLKDQRRKMRIQPFESSKRGTLTSEQMQKLLKAGLATRKTATGSPAVKDKLPALQKIQREPARGTLWLSSLAQLDKFLDEHGRPPSVEYTAPPTEVKLARWVLSVRRLLRRPRVKPQLTDAERRLFIRAGLPEMDQE